MDENKKIFDENHVDKKKDEKCPQTTPSACYSSYGATKKATGFLRKKTKSMVIILTKALNTPLEFRDGLEYPEISNCQ